MLRRNFNASHTQVLTEFDVKILVTDHPAFSRIEIVFLNRPFPHAYLRFAAIAIIFRGMRTEKDVIDPSSADPDLGHQFVIDRFELGISEIPSSDAGLIGHHQHQETCLIKLSDSFRNIRKNMYLRRIVTIGDIGAKRIVPIDQDRPFLAPVQTLLLQEITPSGSYENSETVAPLAANARETLAFLS